MKYGKMAVEIEKSNAKKDILVKGILRSRGKIQKVNK